MQYYTVGQLAKMFNKSETTMRRKVSAGEFGNTLNDGRAHMVSETGLQEYIKQHTGPAHYERHYSNSRGKRQRAPLKRLTLEDVISA